MDLARNLTRRFITSSVILSMLVEMGSWPTIWPNLVADCTACQILTNHRASYSVSVPNSDRIRTWTSHKFILCRPFSSSTLSRYTGGLVVGDPQPPHDSRPGLRGKPHVEYRSPVFARLLGRQRSPRNSSARSETPDKMKRTIRSANMRLPTKL